MNPLDLAPFLPQVFDRIRQMLADRRDARADRREDARRALSAFGEALISTQRYLRDMSTGNRDFDREADLARLWQGAAESLPQISPDLAATAATKMEYWTRPEVWEEARILAEGINIENVFDRYSDLLTEKS